MLFRSEAVAGRVRQEDVAGPCAQVVDCRDDAFLGRIGVMQLGNEAGVDEDGREHTDVVP